MNDLAIWMAAHVSVPLYPTLSAGTVALIYTSRTTGRPKGVMHGVGYFAGALETGLRRIAMTAGERMPAHAVHGGA